MMTALSLRPYQVRTLDACRAEISRGSRAPLIVSPTGSGKTVMGAAIAAGHLARGGQGVLWNAHRKELIEQAADALERCGLTVGVIAPNTRRVNPFARVQVASVQTLRRRSDLPPASLVVFDEAHHFVADDWGVIGKHYAGALRVGLTATPERQDGVGLGELFDSLTVSATVAELTELGHLVPCEIREPGRVLRSGEIAQAPVDAYLEHARGMKTIVFSPHVKAARQHLDEFLAAGVRAALVHGDLAGVERSTIMQRYRRGELDVLVNVYVLTEGFDDPATSCCILARGCGSAGMYLQMVGRILRPSPGKTRALLLDLRGVSHVHGHPDEERTYSLDGRGIRRGGEELPEGRMCQVCGAVLESSVCPDCGRAPSELEAPTVVGIKLQKFERLRRDDEPTRIARLARWIQEARGRGFKEGQALHRYRAAYGDWPSWKIKNAALSAARSAA